MDQKKNNSEGKNSANGSNEVKYDKISQIVPNGVGTNLSNMGMRPLPPMGPPAQSNPNQAIDFDKIKAKLEILKKSILKKYKFTIALGLLPGPAAPLFEEDEALPKEVCDSKPLYMMMIIPEEEYKNIPKIKPEVIKFVKETGENIWLFIKTPVDLWNYGLDSKFEFIDAISGSFPIHDNGFLGALRVANIHKSLVLRKFEKYVASYFIAGSLVRGTAGSDSDVDVFVIVDDTDVKRMPRLELLEKLRGIIYDYIREATALAGVKNILNVQVSLLTDFWQRVRDVEPVAFTFIRDGIPLYDRGTFIPWKLLLKMGRIKPSPEAIDLYMKQGEQTEDFVNRRLMDSMVDTYYGIVTPTQAMVMLAGEGPEVPKNLASQVRQIFVEREKIMSEKDIKILEKAVYLFKQYEYGKLKKFSGKEIDEFLGECREYNKMLTGLRKKLEKKMQEKTASEVYDEVFKLLKTFFGDKTQKELVKSFEKEMAGKGKISPRFVKILKELVNLKEKVKSGKFDSKQVDNAKRDAVELLNSLVEYGQRVDIVAVEKGTMQIVYSGNRKAELVLMGKENFLVEGKDIKKITGDKLVVSTREEFEKALVENKGALNTAVPGEVFKVLEKELGKFEILM